MTKRNKQIMEFGSLGGGIKKVIINVMNMKKKVSKSRKKDENII